MITSRRTSSPTFESFAGISVATKVDQLIKEFESMGLQKSTPGIVPDDVKDGLQRSFKVASQALRTVKEELAAKDRLSHTIYTDMMLKIDDLETAVKTAQGEKKELAQRLKHSENERVKAIERARATEEKMKIVSEQGEKDRLELEREQKRAQQAQKKYDELLRQRKQATPDPIDSEKKKGKESGNVDVAGLQRGLEKLQGQLKKKQTDFQVQAVSLQQGNAKIKNLELKMAEDQKIIEDLRAEIKNVEALRLEDHVQLNSERMNADMEVVKANLRLQIDKKRYEMELKAEIASLKRMLKQSAEKNKKMDEKIGRLQLQLAELQDAVDYEPYGDADIADRIRIRNLVDQTQERLATMVGLTPGPGENLSLCWRLALGPSEKDHIRILRAQELISEKVGDDSTFTEHDRAFIENEEALRHACQSYSRFRAPGNDLHKLLSREGYMTSVQRFLRFAPAEVAGDSLVAMVNYVCPPAFSAV